MTFTDHCMLVLGTLSLAVFAFAGGLAMMSMIDNLIPNLERISVILFPVSNGDRPDSAPRTDDADALLTPEVR